MWRTIIELRPGWRIKHVSGQSHQRRISDSNDPESVRNAAAAGSRLAKTKPQNSSTRTSVSRISAVEKSLRSAVCGAFAN